MNKRTKKIIKIILGILSLILVIVILFFTIGFFILTNDSGYERIPFERNEWLTGTNGNLMHFPRLGMADDLIEKKTLHGLSRDEVINMLGEPALDNKEWDGVFDIVYNLGPERGFMSVDSEWLAIRFDSNGKVKEYKLVRD